MYFELGQLFSTVQQMDPCRRWTVWYISERARALNWDIDQYRGDWSSVLSFLFPFFVTQRRPLNWKYRPNRI